jgi:PAS domain S-box-containing protein
MFKPVSAILARSTFSIALNDQGKTKEQLVSEVLQLRGKIAELNDVVLHLESAEGRLRQTMVRHSTLYQFAPVSLWEEDFSEVAKEIENLRVRGVKDFRSYFAGNAENVILLADKIKVVDVICMSLREIVGMHQSQIHPAEEMDFYNKIFQRQLHAKNLFFAEPVICNKLGRRIPVSIRSKLIELRGKDYVLVIIKEIRKKEQGKKDKSRSLKSATGNPTNEGARRLTPRERQILVLIASGLTNRQIA